MAAQSQVGAGVVGDLRQEGEEEEGEVEYLHFQEEVVVVVAEVEEEALQCQVVEEVEAVLQLEGAWIEKQDLTQSL